MKLHFASGVPLIVVLFGGAMAQPCFAATADTLTVPAQTTAEAGFGYEHLSGGRSPWRDGYVRLASDLARRRHLYGGLATAERFGAQDWQIGIGGAYPLGDRGTVTLDGSASTSAHVVPRWSATGRLHRILDGGRGVELAIGQRVYAQSHVWIIEGTAEQYWREFRATYSLSHARLDEGESGTGHRVQVTRYGAGEGRIGVTLAAGDEAETLGAGVARVIPVRAGSVSGWIPVSAGWWVTYEAGVHRQGTLYTRSRAHLGVRRRL